MNIRIYINEIPIEEYSQEELDEIKIKLTDTAMKAAGLKRNDVLHETGGTGAVGNRPKKRKENRQGPDRTQNAAAPGGY